MKWQRRIQFFIQHPLQVVQVIVRSFLYTFSFLLSLIAYLLLTLVRGFLYIFPRKIRLTCHKFLSVVYRKLLRYPKRNRNTISRVSLIELSMKTMMTRKSRSLITVFGVAIGIGAIVFLLSIGYGVQDLVVSRVADLEEMKQAEVTSQIGGGILLNESSRNELLGIPNMMDVLPLISVVGRVKYEGSSTDVAVYGVTADYLIHSADKPIQGKIFTSNALHVDEKDVAVFSSQESPKIETVAQEFATSGDIVVNWETLEVVSEEETSYEVAELGSNAQREAVVSRALLTLINITPEEAVGKNFSVSFAYIFRENSASGKTGRIETKEDMYTIVGVLGDSQTPFFYVPFEDLRSLGITEYDQMKAIVRHEENLFSARKLIESKGFVTSSVADTVAQINNLFGTIRIILVILGIVALSVASLGMFNTLTVSLLERTREVGLMKAMGMRSSEVRELFLTESMVMGFLGGITGLLLGYLSGELLNFGLSIFSLSQNAGTLDVTSIPFLFVLSIVFLSLIVGVATGVYPARRATRISALNAMRYE